MGSFNGVIGFQIGLGLAPNTFAVTDFPAPGTNSDQLAKGLELIQAFAASLGDACQVFRFRNSLFGLFQVWAQPHF